MIRRAMAAAVAAMVMSSFATAQAPRLRWQAGQVLLYRVEETAQVVDEVGGTKAEAKTRLVVTKRWQVLEVDIKGTATLQLSNASLLFEQTNPAGKVLKYDSAHPEASEPELAKVLGEMVNKPLLVLRVDTLGRAVQIKDAKQPGATLNSFEIDPPFVGVLPPVDALRSGLSWTREYPFVVPPPNGVGEKYPAVQRYTCKSVTGNLATIAFTTEMKDQPKAAADRIPLIQKQPDGEIVFDLSSGCVQSARLQIDREVKEHNGAGSSYRFRSEHTEQLLPSR